MSETAIDRWEHGFRAAAKADGYAILRDHLRRLGLPDSPELLLEGTILIVQAFCEFMDLNDQLLEMQQYDPASSTNARYSFTFDCQNTYARLLVEPGFKAIDLADMYEVFFNHYVWISRTDWSEMASEEMRQLEVDLTNDLQHDYSEEEVGFWFDGLSDKTYLRICVYDVEEEDS